MFSTVQTGINGMKNIQPFIFKFYDEEVALAHNGKLDKRNDSTKGTRR